MPAPFVTSASRRDFLFTAAGTTMFALAKAGAAGAIAGAAPQRAPQARGFEKQRKADLGDGTFLNPIVAGDHPDPSILRDGDDYYMTRRYER